MTTKARPRPKKKDVFDKANLTDTIEKVVLAKDSPINLHEIACELIDLFGGPKGLAKTIHTNYHASASNPQERANILGMLYKIVAAASAKDTLESDDISDEDLMLAMKKHLGRLGIKTDETLAKQEGWIEHPCI